MNATGVWVMSGPGFPCGARYLGDDALGPAPAGRVWLDVCLLGNHMPQMYAKDEIRVLDAGGCSRLGLCPDCLGFGDVNPGPVGEALLAARAADEVRQPCPGCGGTGRPAVRVTITRDRNGASGVTRVLPHAYVPPVAEEDPVLLAAFAVAPGTCVACMMPRDGKGSRGEAIHA